LAQAAQGAARGAGQRERPLVTVRLPAGFMLGAGERLRVSATSRA
jgi:hypothetical protein